MQTSKALDRHKARVGKQRKAADKLLREAVEMDGTLVDSEVLWNNLIAAAKEIYNEA